LLSATGNFFKLTTVINGNQRISANFTKSRGQLGVVVLVG